MLEHGADTDNYVYVDSGCHCCRQSVGMGCFGARILDQFVEEAESDRLLNLSLPKRFFTNISRWVHSGPMIDSML